MLTQQFRWFDHWYPDWSKRTLVPLFALDHPLAEAVWQGLAAGPDFIGDDAGRRIKGPLIALLRNEAQFVIDEEARKRLVGLMVNLTLGRDGKRAVISFAEARRTLIAVSDADRAEALAMLARTKQTDEMWTYLILPFIRPVPHLDTFAYRMKKQGEEGKGYAKRFPAEALALLNALVGEDRQSLPWNLRELLELIAEAAPALRQSDPWRRLKALIQ